MRMTISSLLQEHGHPVKAASAPLGHSSERVTLEHYTRSSREQLERIALTVDEIFAGDAQNSDVIAAEIPE